MNANTATIQAKKTVRTIEQKPEPTPTEPTPDYTRNKPTPQIRNLQRAIAVYKQRALAGKLTEKGAATLAAKEAELKQLKKR
jgi:hypothetical protein